MIRVTSESLENVNIVLKNVHGIKTMARYSGPGQDHQGPELQGAQCTGMPWSCRRDHPAGVRTTTERCSFPQTGTSSLTQELVIGAHGHHSIRRTYQSRGSHYSEYRYKNVRGLRLNASILQWIHAFIYSAHTSEHLLCGGSMLCSGHGPGKETERRLMVPGSKHMLREKHCVQQEVQSHDWRKPQYCFLKVAFLKL